MRTPLRDGKTLGQIIGEEMAPFGLKLDESTQHDILWNETGWPCFFSNGEDTLRQQLREAFARRADPLVKVKPGLGGRKRRSRRNRRAVKP